MIQPNGTDCGIYGIENDEFGLSSGKESNLEGEEFYGYLSAPSEIPVSDIGGAEQPSMYNAQCMLVTALMRAMKLLQGFLLQGKNKCSSSTNISLANDNDTPAPPKSDSLVSEMYEWRTTFI